MEENSKQVKKKERSAFYYSLWKVAVLAVFVLLLLLFFIKMPTLMTPEVQAENFFYNLANGKWDKAFTYMDLEGGEYLTINSMKVLADRYSLSNMGEEVRETMTQWVDPNTRKSKKIQQEYTFTYRVGEKEMTLPVIMKKQKKNSYLFFQNWKVSLKPYASPSFKIQAPKGSIVKWDQRELSPAQIDEQVKNLDGSPLPCDVYLLENVIYGQHSLEISGAGFKTQTLPVEVEPEKDAIIGLSDLPLEEDFLQELPTQAMDHLKTFFAAAVKEDGFDEIKDCFLDEPDLQKQVKEDFEQWTGKEENKRIQSIQVDKIEASLDPSDREKNYFTVILNINGKELIKPKEGSSDQETKEYEFDRSYNYQFVPVKGEWKQINSGFSSSRLFLPL